MATAQEIDGNSSRLTQDYIIVKPQDISEWPSWPADPMDALDGDVVFRGERIRRSYEHRRSVAHRGWTINLKWLVPADPDHLFTIP